MSKQLSVGAMIKRISGLHGTSDLTPWENGFVAGLIQKTNNGEHTNSLSDKQLEVIDRIHAKHFA